jgi:hypothetical protein
MFFETYLTFFLLFQWKQVNGKSSAPMATSESSGGPTRAATSAEEEDDEAKNIDKVENY